jgi:hypothetical protein
MGGDETLSDAEDWLPPLILLADFGGIWGEYVEGVYAFFRRDFIESRPYLDGLPVSCRRDPVDLGKEAGFWHCISEGRDEDERTPDLRRCERIAWVRAVIEHGSDRRVQSWVVRKNRDERRYLWFNETYLVALGARGRYWQLITAFQTDREHTRRKLRKEIRRDGNG